MCGSKNILIGVQNFKKCATFTLIQATDNLLPLLIFSMKFIFLLALAIRWNNLILLNSYLLWKNVQKWLLLKPWCSTSASKTSLPSDQSSTPFVKPLSISILSWSSILSSSSLSHPFNFLSNPLLTTSLLSYIAICLITYLKQTGWSSSMNQDPWRSTQEVFWDASCKCNSIT